MSEFHSALVINCCRTNDVLTLREFVWPIQRSLSVPSKVIQLKKLTEKMANDFDVIIFSGCQLSDNAYLKYASKLEWLKKTKKPVLGICAGQHVLGVVFGGKIKKMVHPMIGAHTIRQGKKMTFLDSFSSPLNVYGLHSHTISLPHGFASAAHSPSNPNEVIFHTRKPLLGVSFHPEVLNKPLFQAFLAWAETFVK